MRIRGDHEKSGNNALAAAILAELGQDPEGSVWTRYKEAHAPRLCGRGNHQAAIWRRPPLWGCEVVTVVSNLLQ